MVVEGHMRMGTWRHVLATEGFPVEPRADKLYETMVVSGARLWPAT